jgi:hypothetical protein
MSEPIGPLEFTILYDLRDPEAWKQAHRHRNWWGKLYTDFYALDSVHVLLVFRPADDPRWRPWEEVRKSWILESAA